MTDDTTIASREKTVIIVWERKMLLTIQTGLIQHASFKQIRFVKTGLVL